MFTCNIENYISGTRLISWFSSRIAAGQGCFSLSSFRRSSEIFKTLPWPSSVRKRIATRTLPWNNSLEKTLAILSSFLRFDLISLRTKYYLIWIRTKSQEWSSSISGRLSMWWMINFYWLGYDCIEWVIQHYPGSNPISLTDLSLLPLMANRHL